MGQTPCGTPTVLLSYGKQKLASTGGAFVPLLTMSLTDSSGCTTKHNYRVASAYLTLVRQQHPVRVIRVNGPTANLVDWKDIYQPNDEIRIEIMGAQVAEANNKIRDIKTTPRLTWLISK